MNEEIRIKMAEREGYEKGKEAWNHPRTRRCGIGLPTYDNDNDLDRYIRGMDDAKIHDVLVQVNRITNGMYPDISFAKATPEQKQLAIIKAEGWE